MDSLDKVEEFNAAPFTKKLEHCTEFIFTHPEDGGIIRFKEGELLTLDDIDTTFIDATKNEFYWNLFDNMYLSKDVLLWGYGFINFDNVLYSEKNSDALAYAYPSLTGRARLEGNEILAKVLRRYKISHSLDLERLSRQLISTTYEFAEEFTAPVYPTKYNFDEKYGRLYAVTEENIREVMNEIKKWIVSHQGMISYNSGERFAISHEIDTDGMSVILSPFGALSSVYPGATVQFGNRFMRIGKDVFKITIPSAEME